jgi:hypothetical protein
MLSFAGVTRQITWPVLYVQRLGVKRRGQNIRESGVLGLGTLSSTYLLSPLN